MMGKGVYATIGIIAVFGLLIVPGGMREATGQIQVNINLGAPPVIAGEPAAMVLVPGSQVYFVPEPGVDVFYYNGYWWSPRGPQWYRSRAYNGPWLIVEEGRVPVPVYRVPKDYRVVYAREKHIPYGQWKKHHKKQAKAESKAWKDHKKVERKESKGHKKGHGKEHHGKSRGEG